jgi:hypothetical protein
LWPGTLTSSPGWHWSSSRRPARLCDPGHNLSRGLAAHHRRLLERSGDLDQRQLSSTALEAIKNALLLNVLIPFKRFLTSLALARRDRRWDLAGWSLGGWRLALLTTCLAYLIAVTGQWEKAMITVYLCGISARAGLPDRHTDRHLHRLQQAALGWVEVAIDTLQTLPSFVYLMPAVMLFRVGDFTAMLAVVAYAVSPVIRYTALGLQGARQPDRGRAGKWLHRMAADDQDPAQTGAARDHARS